MNDLACKADTVANPPTADHDRTGTDGHVPWRKPISSLAAPSRQVLRPVRAPAPQPLPAVQASHGADAPPRGRRRGRTAPAGPKAASPGPQQRADFAVIGLTADDAELWEFVERSRSNADFAGASIPSWRSDGVSAAAAKASLGRRQGAGILVLSRRGCARYTLEQLTGRERDVLAAMAEGRSNRAIARQLSVTEHTVEKHVKNIFAALWLTPSPDDHRRVLAVLIHLTAVASE